MANSLCRDIENGEVVVLKKKILKPEFRALEQRLFIVGGGFGMSDSTMGTALIGKFVSDGEHCRFDGYDIDSTETEKYQKINGKFLAVTE